MTTLAQLTTKLTELQTELTALARTHGSTMEQLLVLCRQMTPIERAIRSLGGTA